MEQLTDTDTLPRGMADPRVLRAWAWTVPAAVALAVGIVLLTLIGWGLGLESMARVIPMLAVDVMVPTTALGLLLCAVALGLLGRRGGVTGTRLFAGRLLAALGALIGAAVLIDYGVGTDLHTAQLLFPRKAEQLASSGPMRPAPISSVNLVLTGLALITLDRVTRRGLRPSELLMLVPVLTSILALAGYGLSRRALVAPELMQAELGLRLMAAHTAVVFLSLSAGVLAARPWAGLAALLSGDDAGGFIARRLLPTAVLVPLVLGWLQLAGRSAGLFGTIFGIAARQVTTIAIIAVIVGWTAVILRRLDRERLRVNALRRRLTAILQATPDLVATADGHGRLLYLNPSGRRLVGLDSSSGAHPQVLDRAGPGTPHAETLHLRTLHPDRERERLVTEILPTARREGVWSGEGMIQAQDGLEVPVSEVVIAHPGADDDVAYYSVVARDISERKRREDEARRATHLRDEVLRVVAHDLRNPLNTIGLGAGLVRELLPESMTTERGQLDVVLRSVDRANRLIQDLLDVARIQAGRLSVECVPTDAAALAREAVALHRGLAEEKSIQLELDAPESLPDVLADRDRIFQVFSNLIGNAIKFTDEGGRIVVSARPVEDAVRFAVCDTGRGIAEENLRRLFDPFWQLRAGTSEGAGLGLAITKGLVEAHGGGLEVESREGEGSEFAFTVPVAG